MKYRIKMAPYNNCSLLLLTVFSITLNFASVVNCKSSFQWKTCEDYQSRSTGIKVSYLKMSPDPIIIPHNIAVEFEAEVLTNLTEPLSLNVEVWMLVNMYWFTARIPVPGCCSFDNVCDMMLEEPPSIKCPARAAENCIDCNECPPPPRKYNTSVTPVSVAVDDLPFYIKLFASGKYEARVTFSDAIGDVLCIDMSLEVTTSSIKAEEPIVLDTLPDYCKALPPKKDSSVNDLA